MELRSTKGSAKLSHFESEILDGAKDIRTTRSTTIRTTTTVREDHGDEIDNVALRHYVDEEERNAKRLFKADSTVRKEYKTSDYSSEENELETTTSLPNPIVDNLKNLQFDHARRSVSVSSSVSHVSALDVYRAAGDYWNKYPKTDYTYSPHSRDRREIAPGVVAMPNMSRRSLHRFTGTDQMTQYAQQSDAAYADDHDYYRYRRSYASANNSSNSHLYDHSMEAAGLAWHRRCARRILGIFAWIYTLLFSVVMHGYGTQNAALIWFGKKVHTTAGRVMLLDTWLLRSTRTGRRTVSLATLCLLPLLAFGAWWALSDQLHPPPTPSSPPPLRHALHTKTEESSRAAPLPTTLHHSNPNVHDIIEQLLQHPEFLSLLSHPATNELNHLHDEIQRLQATVHTQDQLLAALRTHTQRNHARLLGQIRACCSDSLLHMDGRVRALLSAILGAPEGVDVAAWLRSLFVVREELREQLANATAHLDVKMEGVVRESGEMIRASVARELKERVAQEGGTHALGDEHVRRIVRHALRIYDADKTGLVDYALESAGGQVVSTRCTETYQVGTAVMSIFGIPLWYPTNTPRTVLSAGLVPGKCWAFQNFPGFLVVKLSARIRVEAVSVEHVSRLLVPDGRIDSALREFAIYGLRNETDVEPVLLGEFVYDYDGEALQYFAVDKGSEQSFQFVELRVNSNHGNPHYTCLYRLRVHGRPVTEFT